MKAELHFKVPGKAGTTILNCNSTLDAVESLSRMILKYMTSQASIYVDDDGQPKRILHFDFIHGVK